MRRPIRLFELVLIIIVLNLLSCEKDTKNIVKNNTCNVVNPIEDLDWLKGEIAKINQDEYSYYVMAEYKGKTVYYYGNCNPTANYVSIVRNCNGDSLGLINSLSNELSNTKIVWKHVNSKCYFQ